MAYDGPSFHLAPPPESLDQITWDFAAETSNFRNFNFVEGGVYTADQIKRMDRFSQAPHAREGIMQKLVDQYQGHIETGGPIPASGFFHEIPVLRDFDKVADFFSFIWTWIERYGQICSIIVGTALILKILAWIVGVALRLATIPLTGNLCIHICGAFCPSIREFIKAPAAHCFRFFKVPGVNNEPAGRPDPPTNKPEPLVAPLVVAETPKGQPREKLYPNAVTPLDVQTLPLAPRRNQDIFD